MRHESTKRLYAYWNDLRAGRAAPYRSEVDPRRIASLLESTFILEAPAGAAPRFRLAGTRLCDQFGMELRGMSALALWHGDCRARLREMLLEVTLKPCVGHIACSVETRAGRLYDAEFLYLPLRADNGEIARILGCGIYLGGFDARAGGSEPVHHWIDAMNVFPIETDGAGRDGDVVGPITPTPGVNDRVLANLAARRGESPKARRAATLRAIEGGLASGERAERSDIVAAGGARRGHLRLVKSDAS